MAIDVGLLQYPDLQRQCSHGLAYANAILRMSTRFCDSYDQFAQNLKKDIHEELARIPRITHSEETVRDEMYRYMTTFELFHGVLEDIANSAQQFSLRLRESVVSPLEEFHSASVERLKTINADHKVAWDHFRDQCTVADHLRQSAVKHIAIEKERFDTCLTLASGGKANGSRRSSLLASQAMQSLSSLLKRASFHRSSLEIGVAPSSLESPLEWYIRHKYRPARDKCKTAESRYTEHLGSVNISMAEYESCREEALHELKSIESERLGRVSEAWQHCHEALLSVDYAIIHHDSFKDFTNALSSLDKEHALSEFHALSLSKGKYKRPKTLEPQLPRWRSHKHAFQDIMDLQRTTLSNSDLPFIVDYLCGVIANGADEPDILLRNVVSSPAEQKANDEILEAICQGATLDEPDPHHASALLKSWLSSTLEPVIPYGLYDKCCQFIDNTRDLSPLTRIDEGKMLMAAVPPVNKQVLTRILWLCEVVASRGNVMIIDIADVLADFLLRDPEMSHGEREEMLVQDEPEGGSREFVTFLLQHRAELELVSTESIDS